MPHKDAEARRAYQKAYRLAHKDKQREYLRAWQRAHPEKVSEYTRKWNAENVERCREKAAIWRKLNADRKRQTNAAWHKANAVHRAEMRRAWRAANPDAERAIRERRRTGGEARACDIADTFAMAEGLCAYCLKPCARLTLDHVQPISRSGGNELDNLVAACLSCNSAKCAKTPLEFLCKLPKLG